MTNRTNTLPALRAAAVPTAAGPQPAVSDPKLPQLRHVFDVSWAWRAYCNQFGEPEETPDRLRLDQFVYRPGRRAVVGYVAERRWDTWVVEDQFAFEVRAGKELRLFRYPDDPYLPGLATVADAVEAHTALPKYVGLHPHRLHIESVRYRPTTRAVLRYRAWWRRRDIGEVILYVRVMPPAELADYIAAGKLTQHSGFVLPRVAGHWPEGGVVWLVETPGRTVRNLIREGAAPEPHRLLDGLEPLWAAPLPQNAPEAFDAAGAFSWSRDVISESLPTHGEARDLFNTAVRELKPFVAAWRPTGLAHNDFYDDQVLGTPDGRIALVDFEETGPGEPLLDVGNMLAHLRWMGHYAREAERFAQYRVALRAAALERFGWNAHELALREAFSLFRLCTNPIRSPGDDSLEMVGTLLGLLVNQVLEDVA